MAKDKVNKFAFVIPTKGRYEKIRCLLESISNQTTKPDLVIIIDSNKLYGGDTINNINNNSSYRFCIKYIHTGPNSLTEARNIGIRNVPGDFNLIGFLDDDVILEKDALKNMLKFWEGASLEIGGVAFNVMDSREPRKFWFLKRIFFMGDKYPGNILSSGYQTMLNKIKKNTFTKWLPGGVTVWRREVFDYFKFDEELTGYGYIEDLDFSYSVSKRFKLVALENAKLMHKPHPVSREKQINFGCSEIKNRYYFISKHKEFSKLLFYWASVGKLFENIILGILTLNSNYLKRAWGNILGLSDTMKGYF